MPENGAIVQADFATPAAPKPHKPDRGITINEAKQAAIDAKYNKLDVVELKARCKVGKWVEQEGEHHLARATLAKCLADSESTMQFFEKKASEALAAGDAKEHLRNLRLAMHARELVMKAAVNLNATRRKVDPSDAPMPNSPTMPARTVITNNTQINMAKPEPKAEPSGNAT